MVRRAAGAHVRCRRVAKREVSWAQERARRGLLTTRAALDAVQPGLAQGVMGALYTPLSGPLSRRRSRRRLRLRPCEWVTLVEGERAEGHGDRAASPCAGRMRSSGRPRRSAWAVRTADGRRHGGASSWPTGAEPRRSGAPRGWTEGEARRGADFTEAAAGAARRRARGRQRRRRAGRAASGHLLGRVDARVADGFDARRRGGRPGILHARRAGAGWSGACGAPCRREHPLRRGPHSRPRSRWGGVDDALLAENRALVADEIFRWPVSALTGRVVGPCRSPSWPTDRRGARFRRHARAVGRDQVRPSGIAGPGSAEILVRRCSGRPPPCFLRGYGVQGRVRRLSAGAAGCLPRRRTPSRRRRTTAPLPRSGPRATDAQNQYCSLPFSLFCWRPLFFRFPPSPPPRSRVRFGGGC